MREKEMIKVLREMGRTLGNYVEGLDRKKE